MIGLRTSEVPDHSRLAVRQDFAKARHVIVSTGERRAEALALCAGPKNEEISGDVSSGSSEQAIDFAPLWIDRDAGERKIERARALQEHDLLVLRAVPVIPRHPKITGAERDQGKDHEPPHEEPFESHLVFLRKRAGEVSESDSAQPIFRFASHGIARQAPRVQESAGDTVHLEKLQVSARVGVPDDERAVPQRLVISLTLWPKANFDRLNDDLTETIDYAAVAKAVRSFVSEREDKLIETLASALAAHLLGSFDLRVITIEVRKFVIPDSEYVAVIVTRSANERR